MFDERLNDWKIGNMMSIPFNDLVMGDLVILPTGIFSVVHVVRDKRWAVLLNDKHNFIYKYAENEHVTIEEMPVAF